MKAEQQSCAEVGGGGGDWLDRSEVKGQRHHC